MNKVWIVEHGEYSSYRVVGIFTSRKYAQLIANMIGGSVDSRPLNPSIDNINNGLGLFSVWMLKDGTTELAEREEIDVYNIIPSLPWIWRRSTAPAYKGKGLKDVLRNTVWAKDEQHAIKITNEVRTRMIADGKWRE